MNFKEMLKSIFSATPEKEPMKLTPAEASFLADYFYSYHQPDYDGYLGQTTVPEQVMEIYRRRYSEERGWNE